MFVSNTEWCLSFGQKHSFSLTEVNWWPFSLLSSRKSWRRDMRCPSWSEARPILLIRGQLTGGIHSRRRKRRRGIKPSARCSVCSRSQDTTRGKKTARFFEPFISKENVLFYIKCYIYSRFMWVYFIRQMTSTHVCLHGCNVHIWLGVPVKLPSILGVASGKVVFTGLESTERLRRKHCLSVDVDYLFVSSVLIISFVSCRLMFTPIVFTMSASIFVDPWDLNCLIVL